MRLVKFQRLFLVFVFLCFGFSILGFSLFRCFFCQKKSPEQILAVEEATQEITPEEEQKNEPPSSLPTPEPVDYYLAYPGVLPDHFLYPFKMIRDRIWLVLTTGAKQKSQVMLLFADKRLGAGKALIESGKKELGVTTITKGEKYLEQAVGQLAKVKAENVQEIDELKEKFLKAAEKHEEILLKLKEQVSTDQWGAMDKMLGKIKMLREEIDAF